MKATKDRQIKIDIPSLEQDLHDFFINCNEITLAYVFGSLINKSKDYVHDIDIAVLVVPDILKTLNQATPYGYMAQLSSELSNRARCDRIDQIMLNDAPPVLLKEIIGKGKSICCVSDNERIRFEISALQRHADTLHLRKIKRIDMQRRITEGLTAYAGSINYRSSSAEYGRSIGQFEAISRPVAERIQQRFKLYQDKNSFIPLYSQNVKLFPSEFKIRAYPNGAVRPGG